MSLIVAAAVVIVSLSPFANWKANSTLAARLDQFVEVSHVAHDSLGEWLGHICGSLLLGAAALTYVRTTRTARPVATSLLVVLAICTFIEAYQVLMPSPHEGQIVDWVINVLGCSLGVGVASRTYARGARAARWYHRRQQAVLSTTLGVVPLIWLAMLLLPSVLPISLASWNRTYPLLVGNELTNDRPWLGEVRYVAIYDRALSAEQVHRRFSSEKPPGDAAHMDSTGLLAVYDFTMGDERGLRPRSSVGAPSLSIDQPNRCRWLTDGGLLIERPATIKSVEPPKAIVNAVVGAGRFSVEVVFRPANLTQAGPARILSISTDPYERDFMIGQVGRGVEVRIRNTVAGINGIFPALVVKQPVLSDSPQHAIVTYSGRASHLYLKGHQVPFSVEYRTPSTVLGLGAGDASQFTGAFLVGLPVMAALCGLLGSGRRAARALIATSLTFAVIESGWIVRLVLTGYHPSPAIVALVIAATVIAYLTFDATCRSRGDPAAVDQT